MSTATSATWLPAFIRYSWIRAAVRWPGPVNQKLVPGLVQAAVGRLPALVCSASRPWASAPLAWMTTPPLTGDQCAALLPGRAVFAACRSSSWSRCPFLVPPVPVAVLVWADWSGPSWSGLGPSSGRGPPGHLASWGSRGPGGAEHPRAAAALPVPVSRVTFSARTGLRRNPRPPAEVITAMPPGGAGGGRRGRADPLHRGDRRQPRCCGGDPAVSEMSVPQPGQPVDRAQQGR